MWQLPGSTWWPSEASLGKGAKKGTFVTTSLPKQSVAKVCASISKWKHSRWTLASSLDDPCSDAEMMHGELTLNETCCEGSMHGSKHRATKSKNWKVRQKKTCTGIETCQDLDFDCTERGHQCPRQITNRPSVVSSRVVWLPAAIIKTWSNQPWIALS